MAAASASAQRTRRAEVEQAKRTPLTYTPQKRHVLYELCLLLFCIALLATPTLYMHYRLPAPRAVTSVDAPKPQGPASDAWYREYFAHTLNSQEAATYHPSLLESHTFDGPLHSYFSEANAMLTMQYLSEDVGFRVVGTQQHIDAEVWLEEVLRRFEGTHATGTNYSTQVEVFRQQSDGAHRFDILGFPVWKQYYGMSNLIVRISDGTEESKANSLLVNAHLDSTLPSPGAADDAAGVSIMMEALRVLTLRGAPRVRHGLVLLFNNGEESLQDASHLYMTQEVITRPTVRAVVNLEGCGVSGPTLLFQATDPALIEAFRHVPHPFGTVLASDVFSSGIIMSDTDFRQFQHYGHGLPGLDMAIVGSSYLYHTRRDVPKYMERGVVQHLGENAFSLIESLCLSESSPLPTIRPWPYETKRILPIYFSIFGSFLVLISPYLFKNLITTLSVLVNFMLSSINTTERRVRFIHMSMLSTIGVALSYVAAIVAANAVAFCLRSVGSPLSWFQHEFHALLAFAPPAIAAIVGVQLFVHSLAERTRRPYLEYTSFTGATVFYTLLLLLMNFYGLGSAHVMFIATLSYYVPVLINDLSLIGLKRIGEGVNPDARMHLATYFVHLILPCTFGTEGIVAFLDLLVPLMGRMGTDAPADHVIASLVAALVTLVGGFVPALCHRYGRAFMQKAIYALLAVSCITTALFAAKGANVFDDKHPRRLFLHHVENVTSGEWHLSYSVLDAGAKNPQMDAAILRTALGSEPNATLSWDDAPAAAPDMDILFPLTHFIGVTRVTLPRSAERDELSLDGNRWSNVRLTCEDTHYDVQNQTRHVIMRLEHPQLAWSTVSFDADLVDWDFPEPPPMGMQRHHMKDVSRLGSDVFEMRLVMRVAPEDMAAAEPVPETLLRSPPMHEAMPVPRGHIPMHFSGIDSFGMYPHHKNVSMDRLSMRTLAALDDELQRDFPEVDAMLLSIVGGVAVC